QENQIRTLASSRWGERSFFLSADAPEHEGSLGLYNLTVHLKQRISQEIDRSAGWLRINHQITALCKFEPVRRIMAKVVIRQLWIFPSLADINRHPPSIGKKFCPAMIAVDCALVFVRGNGRADRETGWYADATR